MKEKVKLNKTAAYEERDCSPRKTNVISFNSTNKINNNYNNSYKSHETYGFATTKSNNLSFVKKQILSPIKEVVIKPNPLKLKTGMPNKFSNNETTRNLRNKTLSKIVLNPIIDPSAANSYSNNKIIKSAFNNKNFISSHNSNNTNCNNNNNNNNNNKSQVEKSIIDEEPFLKTKESEIFRLTNPNEKQDTKSSFFKKKANYNIKDVSINTNMSLIDKDYGNESERKFFSKLNSNNMKKIEINSFKNSNCAIDDMFSTETTNSNKNNNNNNNNNGINSNNISNKTNNKNKNNLNSSIFSAGATTKYNSISQSNVLNTIFNTNNKNTNIIDTTNTANISSNNINNTNFLYNNSNLFFNNNINNTTNNKSTSNQFNSIISEIEALKRKSNISSSFFNQENSEGKELIGKIEQKVFCKKADKYPLIPNNLLISSNMIFKDSNPLKSIFINCSDNLNITNKLHKLIGTKANKKLKCKAIEKLKKKEGENSVEKDLKLDMSFKDKVFMYGGSGANGGYYASPNFDHMQKYNLISKISNNLAMTNRNSVIKQLHYDFKADKDYIYQSELRDLYLQKLKKEKQMEMVNVNDKHRKVDCYLDNTLKKNEILLQRIDNDLAKYEREKNRYAGDRNNNNSDSSGNN